jgi:hypothetical protein
VNGFDWWASQKPRADSANPLPTSVSAEPRAESIGSVPFMRAGRKVASPSKTVTASSEASAPTNSRRH